MGNEATNVGDAMDLPGWGRCDSLMKVLRPPKRKDIRMFKWILVTVASIVSTVSAAWPALAGSFGSQGGLGSGAALGAPELSATAAGGAIALLAGGLMLLAERRRKSQPS